MGNVIDLTGHQYGRLTVLHQLPYEKHGTLWECRCSCGNTHAATSNTLRRKKVQSCGCLHKDVTVTHGQTETKLYVVWASMLQRCYNTKAQAYKNYGAIGVIVCPEWKEDFKAFHDWAYSNRYTEGLSIDRIECAKVYSPTTCRWTTPTIQLRNQRIKTGGSCEYVGVFHKANGYEVCVTINRKQIYLGRFKDPVEAAKVRDAYIKDNNLEGFTLNFN